MRVLGTDEQCVYFWVVLVMMERNRMFSRFARNSLFTTDPFQEQFGG